VLHVCLTHLHLDHVEGLGFFEPLWTSGWKLHFWGPPSTTTPLKDRMARYLSPPLFPVGLSEAPAEVVFEDVPREPWPLGSALIEAEAVEHRGPTVGYRIEVGGPYLTAALDDEPEWISGWALAAGADLLFHDSQYTEEEYAQRLGWGHSSVNQAAAFARSAGVRQLGMFHHDPVRSDRELEELYDQVAEIVRADQEPPLIAREGLEIALGAG
jgi:ribonuclease BN (tRNA processing enzyme)